MGGGRLRGVVAHGGSTVNLNKVCRDHNLSKAQFIRHTFAKLNIIVLGLTEVQQKHDINSYLVTELNVIVNVVSRQWL